VEIQPCKSAMYFCTGRLRCPGKRSVIPPKMPPLMSVSQLRHCVMVFAPHLGQYGELLTGHALEWRLITWHSRVEARFDSEFAYSGMSR
jgi:hypothetical protein